jgi:hypothetical protein
MFDFRCIRDAAQTFNALTPWQWGQGVKCWVIFYPDAADWVTILGKLATSKGFGDKVCWLRRAVEGWLKHPTP